MLLFFCLASPFPYMGGGGLVGVTVTDMMDG